MPDGSSSTAPSLSGAVRGSWLSRFPEERRVTDAATGPQDKHALAIDLGTTCLKVGLVSLTGAVAWATSADLRTRHAPEGSAEQDASQWWSLIRDAARAAL